MLAGTRLLPEPAVRGVPSALEPSSSQLPCCRLTALLWAAGQSPGGAWEACETLSAAAGRSVGLSSSAEPAASGCLAGGRLYQALIRGVELGASCLQR